MSINLHIQPNESSDSTLNNDTPLNILPIDTPLKKKHIRKGMSKYENFNKDTLITYRFFKTHLYSNTKKKHIFIYKKQLQKTLDTLNIIYPKSFKKGALESLLFTYYNTLVKYDTNDGLHKLNIISKAWKEYILKKRDKIYGPGYRDRNICKNHEDCFTFETIDDIPDKFFFSIQDTLGHVFFFDVRTFYKLFQNKSHNPYTREPFTKDAFHLFNERRDHMIKHNIDIIYPEELEYIANLTPSEKIRNRLLDIFGDIDRLNVIAGGTKLTWFTNLNIIQLKKFYRHLEDVWNYRADLSDSQKNDIVPDNNMFPNSVQYLFSLTSIIEIQNIILNEIEKLVKSAPNEEHQHTGAYYVLISLTEISYECAQELPWLIQY
jgi:hypothetical protein